MTIDLWMLVATAVLHFVLVMIAATPRLLINGFGWGLGNRHGEAKELPDWADRAQRASNNMQENLGLAAILILVVHVSGNGSDTTALGAQVFFGARVLHAIAFIAGVPLARTVIWATSIAGLVMVGAALL